MLFNSCVRSPVAVGTFRCSASTYLVSVMQSESIIVFFDVIVAVLRAAGRTRGNSRAENETVSTETETDAFETLRYIKQRLVGVIATVKTALIFDSELALTTFFFE